MLAPALPFDSASILTGAARLAGVFGWPIAHSRSPRLHGFWLRRYGIDGAYVPLGCPPDAFAVAVRGLRAAGFRGANVTAPHKQAAFALCDHVEESAARAGAVNTLTFAEDRIHGANTDGYGFLESLREAAVDPTSGPALLLGAGGAARAIAAALLALGVPVAVANRTGAHAQALARALPGLRLLDWSAREEALGEYALLVNTTPCGMDGRGALAMDLSRAHPTLAVADIVYVPLETPLLAQARARGLRTVDGLGMLLHQARPGFAAWFGVDPVVDAALRAFVAADIGAT